MFNPNVDEKANLDPHCAASRRVGCMRMLISKWSTAGFFFKTSCCFKAKEIQSVQLIIYMWGEKSWIHAFAEGISTKWSTDSLVQDLNSGRWTHFLHW